MRTWQFAAAGGLVGAVFGIPAAWGPDAVGAMLANVLVGALIGGLLGRWLDARARK